MPSIKSRMPSGVKAQEVKSGFEAYDGPAPTKRGFYRAKVTSCKWGKNSGGSYGFTIVANLEAAPGDPKDHAQFDGFPMFSHSIITETSDRSALKEGSVNNLSNLYAAMGAKDDPDVIVGKGDPDESKVDVTKIGTVNPVGRIINIDLGFETYNSELRPTFSGIFGYKDEPNGKTKAGPKFVAEDEDADDAEDESDLTEDYEEFAAREEELTALTLAKIKAIAKEAGVTGKNKAELIEAILDAEFPEDGAAALDDEDEADDEEEDDEDEEEGDEEEDDDDGRGEREEELSTFNRVALKKVLAEVNPDFRVLKRHEDDDLREAILTAEFGEDDETPF